MSLVALSLSIGMLHPRGPVTLTPLPIANNWIWLSAFTVVNIVFCFWSMAAIFRRGIREMLERHTTLHRSFLLADIALVVAGGITFGVSTRTQKHDFLHSLLILNMVGVHVCGHIL